MVKAIVGAMTRGLPGTGQSKEHFQRLTKPLLGFTQLFRLSRGSASIRVHPSPAFTCSTLISSK